MSKIPPAARAAGPRPHAAAMRGSISRASPVSQARVGATAISWFGRCQ